MLLKHTFRFLKTAIVIFAKLMTEARAASDANQLTFISPTSEIRFGLTIPTNNDDDLLFTLSMPESISWGAIGLGNTVMKHTLILMIYSSKFDNNVTFSPRLSTGHGEPHFYENLRYTALPNTGIFNHTLVYSAVCHNCRSWPHGAIDVTSSQQGGIFANGPKGAISSNDISAALQFHAQYGSFTMDLTKATGPPIAPQVSLESKNSFVSLGKGFKLGAADWQSISHAIIMIISFYGLMPVGVLILRRGKLVRWHGINQTVAMLGVVGGSVLGFGISTSYVRSGSFDTAHQVIGLVVFLSIIGQFLLGFFHHRIYKRTKLPTRLAPFHVWLGRAIIPLGILNGFLGFPLALSPIYNYVLAAILITITPIFTWLLVKANK